MSGKWYTNEFKEKAFKQVIERGYTVREAAKRLDVSAHSLYKWVKAVKPDKTDEQAAALLDARVHLETALQWQPRSAAARQALSYVGQKL